MTTDAPEPNAPPSRPRRLRGRALLAGALAMLLLAVLVVGGGAGWLLGTASGSAWLLSKLPGVTVDNPRGALAGDFQARQLVVALPGGTDHVTLTDAGWRGVSLQRGAGPLWAKLTIDALYAARIDVTLAPKPPQPNKPAKAPADLKSPVEVEIKSVKVGEIRATPLGQTVVTDLDAALHVGAAAGTVHRIDRLGVRIGGIEIGAKGQIASTGPMALKTTVDGRQAATGGVPAWAATLHLTGPLAEPVLDATLRASPVTVATASGSGSGSGSGVGAGAGSGSGSAAATTVPPAAPSTPSRTASAPPRAAAVRGPSPPARPPEARRPQSLDLHAVLRPFAPWPLGDLTANARALDASAFVATAPQTALDLDARATSTGADRPAVLTVDIANAAAGRYDEARLPVQSLRAEIAVRPDRATEIEVRSAVAVLGSAREAGGEVRVQGRWSPTRWEFDTTLDRLQAKRLDGRAPALLLSGPVHAASADAGRIDLKTSLRGALDDAGTVRPVTADVDASFDLAGPAKRLTLALLQASAGAARLKATGTATQADAAAPWQLKADASVADFDPGVWLAGAPHSPWRGTRNRVDARLSVDAAAALPASGESALDAIARARGRATLSVDNSVLAGVPLQGKADVQIDGQTAHVIAHASAAGNALQADGRLATRGKAAGDTLDLVLDARSLAALAPVFKLFQPAGADATLAGRLSAHAHVAGRWPNLNTRGDLEAQGLRVGGVGLGHASGQWVAGTAPTDRVSLDLSVDQLTFQPRGAPPGPSLDTARVQLEGTARSHTLDLRVASRARPPAWAEAVAGVAPVAGSGDALATSSSSSSTGTGTGTSRTTSTNGSKSTSVAPPARLTVATLRARGGLVDLRDAPLSGWRGTLESVDVASNDPRAPTLLKARALSLEAFWGGGPLRADVRPGRLDLLGGVLRWTRLQYAAANAGASSLPRVDVDATIEPLRIAPLLAQFQPSFGWGGDLAIGGRVSVQSGLPGHDGVRADVALERSAGDLAITDELGTRRLGLSELRVGLQADDGLWKVSTRLAGQSIGRASADASVRTSPQALFPPADAPLEGRLDLDIADLDGFAAGVPPGWRVDGTLAAHATLGGRVGQPEYVGEIVGRQLTARNFLEGVSATDGDLRVRLAGTTATLEHFTARGGDGLVRMSGSATFDATPAIKLDITADHFQVLGRIDRKIVASGHAAVQIDAQRIAVTGQFGVDQGLIDITRSDAPALGEDVTVIRAAGVLSPAAAASAAESPTRNAPLPTPTTAEPVAGVRAVDLNLQLDLGPQLAIRGHGLSARLAGALRVTSPQSKVAVNGTVNVVDGTFKAYGQDLVIDRGAIVFTGPVDRPRLDIEATRPKLDNLRVGVTITGSVANPRIRLFSEPELSDVDKLSYLVLGRGSDNLGRNESALLQSAAMALVSGEGNGEPGITDRVTKALGLDELSLGQTTDGTVKQTVVNVGKQLSDRWSIGYQAGLNAAAGSVQLIYKVAKRITVRAQAGTASSLDLIWSWRWQ